MDLIAILDNRNKLVRDEDGGSIGVLFGVIIAGKDRLTY